MIKLDRGAAKLINILESAGYEAYAVGGCVRDSLLGDRPEDWDIATDAEPETVKSIFHRTYDTGIEHGTVTVLLMGGRYEVTTYRVDGDYRDGRHPDRVYFTRRLEDDLARRDFTINAMAYNDETGLVDLYGGQRDLEAGVIRCVGDPQERFGEDALRILRAVRFSAKLGFAIEDETLAALRSLAPTLAKISEERIAAEFIKLVTSKHPDYIRVAYECGVTAVIFPEWDALMREERDIAERRVTRVRPDRSLRLAALLCDIVPVMERVGKNTSPEEVARGFMRRLKLDNDTINRTCALIRFCRFRLLYNPDSRAARELMRVAGAELVPDLLELRGAMEPAKSEAVRLMRAQCDGVIDRGEAVYVGQLAINGTDLINLGIKPGPAIGLMLESLLDEAIENPAVNTREKLLQLASALRTAV